jgi:hypothetical protein
VRLIWKQKDVGFKTDEPYANSILREAKEAEKETGVIGVRRPKALLNFKVYTKTASS